MLESLQMSEKDERAVLIAEARLDTLALLKELKERSSEEDTLATLSEIIDRAERLHETLDKL